MARVMGRPRYVPEREVYPFSRTHIARLRKKGLIKPAKKFGGPRSQNFVDTQDPDLVLARDGEPAAQSRAPVREPLRHQDRPQMETEPALGPPAPSIQVQGKTTMLQMTYVPRSSRDQVPRPTRRNRSARRHFDHGTCLAAFRAFTAARLYACGSVPTLAMAASACGSNPAYAAAAQARRVAELVSAYRKALPEDLVALGRTVGAETLFKNMIEPALG
jgi:hypothetical protein